MSKKEVKVVWKGNLKEGQGRIEFANGAFNQEYTFSSRFEEGDGTSPEELLAAAHASCFSMALSAALSEAGFVPDRVETVASAELNPDGDDFKIGSVSLHTRAQVPNIEEGTFQEIAEYAKNNCPVSKALGNVEIKLSAELNQ
jgi:osmotically inducible protein OsmC